MRAYITLILCLLLSGLKAQQPVSNLVKTESFKDENGQHISFQLPQNWKFKGGVIHNAKGSKVGEFMPGTIADCKYKSGNDYLKELKAGYPDDMGNPKFVGSRILLIGSTTWTEGIRNVPAWDGKRNADRWYTHDLFALLNKKCFLITFYSQQKQLPDEDVFKSILASIKLTQ